MGDGACVGMGRGTRAVPVGRSAFALLPFPQELLFRMRRHGLRFKGFPLLGLRSGGIHRGRGGPCGGVAPSRDGARTEGTPRTKPDEQ